MKKKYQAGGLKMVGRSINPEYLESLKTNGAYPKYGTTSSNDWQQLNKFDNGDTLVKANDGKNYLRDNKSGKYHLVDSEAFKVLSIAAASKEQPKSTTTH